MTSHRFVVDADRAGQRLDVALADWLAESRNQAASRIERGEVQVDGSVAAKSLRLVGGETVEVAAPPPSPAGAADVEPPPVRWQDEHLFVVAKPAGVVVHPGAGHPAGTLVQALAAAGYRLAPAGGETRPGIVHRLDRGTSGLLAVAKTDSAYRGLVRALKAREVERRYAALAEGTLPAATGRVEVPIARDPGDRTRFAAVAGGKPAVTHWRVLASGEWADADGVPIAVTFARCRLETGRTHQIRVHLSYAGHPVVGDRRYGARRDLTDALGLERPFLHAGFLGFVHPVTGIDVAVHERLPGDLVAAAVRCGIDPALTTAPLAAGDGGRQ